MNYNVPVSFQLTINKLSTKKTVNDHDKQTAFDQLAETMRQGMIKEANYWGAVLLSSGYHVQLWDTLLLFYFKYINCLDPRMINYLNQQYLLYCEIKKTYTGHLKNLCNNQELRNHLAELITLLCISHKQNTTIPDQLSDDAIDQIILDKSTKFINIFAKNISKQSLLHQNLSGFVINYYNNSIDNCIYYLDWFVRDVEYVVETDIEFKIPPILINKSILLMVKFLILQIKAQIRINKKNINVEQVTEMLDTSISFYIMLYKKKNYDACVHIAIYILLFSRCIDKINQLPSIDAIQSSVIKQCAEINLVYQQMKSPNQLPPKGKSNGKGKSKANPQFYEDPSNQEYLRMINDCTLLMKNVQIKDVQVSVPTNITPQKPLMDREIERDETETESDGDDETGGESDDDQAIEQEISNNTMINIELI